MTRPDITYAVNRVCQFMHAPSELHWNYVKRILRYLQGTSKLGLFYSAASPLRVQVFTDADWAGNQQDRKSTGGFLTYLGCNLITWQAKKQRTVARSSTEAEYKSLADGAADVVWLRNLLCELGYTKLPPPILWCDNLGATYMAANPVFHARTKHVEVDFHFVRDLVKKGDLSVQYVCTTDQLADVLTKSLSTKRFNFLRSKLSLMSSPSQFAGECKGNSPSSPSSSPSNNLSYICMTKKHSSPTTSSSTQHNGAITTRPSWPPYLTHYN